MSLPPPVCWRMLRHILTSLFSYHQLNKARNAYFRGSKLVVVYNELTPVVRESNILIPHMIELVLQLTIEISIPRRHIEQSVARKSKHSADISAFLAVMFMLRLGPLLVVVRAGCRLTAFIGSPDISVHLDISLPVSN